MTTEARSLSTLAGDQEKTELRRALIEAFEDDFPFPLKATFKAYVVRERLVKRVKVKAGPGGTEEESQPCLEVVPERFGKEAYDLLGGILVPFKRRLEPGSVLELTVELRSLSKYRLNPPGMMARLVSCDVLVGVEA